MTTGVSSMPGQRPGVSALQRANQQQRREGGAEALRKGSDYIRTITARIGADNIRSAAEQNFARVIEQHIGQGQKHEALVAACIFFACSERGCPRTLKEIKAGCSSAVTKENIGQCTRILATAFSKPDQQGPVIAVTAGSQLVARFGRHLRLDQAKINACEHVADAATNLYDVLAGRAPATVAAAAIYLVTLCAGVPVSLEG